MAGLGSLWMVASLLTVTHARDVVRTGASPRPAEAWYVLKGAQRLRCTAEVVVGADGRVEGARATGCPVVLANAVEASAQEWRWERSVGVTVETIEVDVRSPRFTPRPSRRECLVAFDMSRATPQLLADVPPRCGVATTPPPTLAPTRRHASWCAVDVVVQDGAIASTRTEDCTEGFARAAVDAVRAWDLNTSRDQHWRMLLEFPADP